MRFKVTARFTVKSGKAFDRGAIIRSADLAERSAAQLQSDGFIMPIVEEQASPTAAAEGGE